MISSAVLCPFKPCAPSGSPVRQPLSPAVPLTKPKSFGMLWTNCISRGHILQLVMIKEGRPVTHEVCGGKLLNYFNFQHLGKNDKGKRSPNLCWKQIFPCTLQEINCNMQYFLWCNFQRFNIMTSHELDMNKMLH